jgi:hypothetical protein
MAHGEAVIRNKLGKLSGLLDGHLNTLLCSDQQRRGLVVRVCDY